MRSESVDVGTWPIRFPTLSTWPVTRVGGGAGGESRDTNRKIFVTRAEAATESRVRTPPSSRNWPWKPDPRNNPRTADTNARWTTRSRRSSRPPDRRVLKWVFSYFIRWTFSMLTIVYRGRVRVCAVRAITYLIWLFLKSSFSKLISGESAVSSIFFRYYFV